MLIAAALVLAFWGRRAASAPDHSGTVLVAVLDHAHVQTEEPVRTVTYGGSVEFILNLDVGWSVSSADYPDHSITPYGANSALLRLDNVTAPVRVGLEVSKAQAVICYHAAGGRVLDAEEDVYYENYDLTYHKRANTSLGYGKLQREGYTLVGWNTEPDLSGAHIGLGSRVTVPAEENILDLYAEWAQWTPERDFVYVSRGVNAELTGYTGNAETVVVPETLGGLPVAVIGTDCFAGTAVSTVILPNTVLTVRTGAFQDCGLKELYFFDDLMEISDDSFINCPNFSSIHINAAHLPCYAALSRHSRYADKIDLLILSLEAKKPRMVFMSGSSMWFSLDGALADDYFDREYTVINVALNGFYSGTAQFEVLKNFLREGDVFIHAPEECSEYQLMATDEMTQNMYTCFELNYDLMSGVDIRRMSNVFSAYTEYNAVRRDLPQTGYDEREATDWIDEYGCIPFTRPAVNGDEDLLDDAYIGVDMLTREALQRLNSQYAEIQAITGAPVLFAFGPINYDGLPEGDRSAEVWSAFETTIREGLESAVLITHLEDAVFRGSSFYYTDFHLNSEATKIHTQRLCGGIAATLKGEDM